MVYPSVFVVNIIVLIMAIDCNDVIYGEQFVSILREHPFNLKGGGGYGFYRIKNIFSRQVVATLFFSTKTTIFKAQSANRIFFLPISQTEFFFKQICQQKLFSPNKNIAPPPLQVKWMFPKRIENKRRIGKSGKS